MGPEGGDAGGEVVAQGTPEQIARNPKSYTGQYLKPVLARKGKGGRRARRSSLLAVRNASAH
jgi:excinuclease ABC subunit A